MRAYFFMNMYLSSIQNGIQSAHVVAELFYKYQINNGSHRSNQYCQLMDWANRHKTMILLNAGYSEELHNLQEFFLSDNNHYPWALFKESQEALDGAFTCIGIILPERIYETAKYCTINNTSPQLLQTGLLGKSIGMPNNLSDWECELIQKLYNYPLAK